MQKYSSFDSILRMIQKEMIESHLVYSSEVYEESQPSINPSI